MYVMMGIESGRVRLSLDGTVFYCVATSAGGIRRGVAIIPRVTCQSSGKHSLIFKIFNKIFKILHLFLFFSVDLLFFFNTIFILTFGGFLT